MQGAARKAKAEGLREGIAQGMEQGIEQGIQKGIKEGTNKRTLELASNMLKENIDINVISRISGLTKAQINKLR